MTTNHQKLEAAIKRRDAAKDSVQRLQGRLAAAQEDVVSIEKECSERGVPPEKLDAAIEQLERRYDAAVASFVLDVASVEEKLAPFQEDDRS